jgi:polygalacturonase
LQAAGQTISAGSSGRDLIRVLVPRRGTPNKDGLDPFSSSHIIIDHYFSSVGDDNIAINSPGPDTPSTDITTTDCQFEFGHSLSIGREVSGGVQRVHAERISFKDTDQGSRVKANRDCGADGSEMGFKDITMDNVRTPYLFLFLRDLVRSDPAHLLVLGGKLLNQLFDMVHFDFELAGECDEDLLL